MSSRVAGIDGAKGGWVVAEVIPGSPTCSIRFEPTIAPVVAELGTRLSSIVVDMPIGLSDDGVRPVDAVVRARLGARHSTFFPTPLRDVLGHATWETANASSRELRGKGLSKQAWNLVPKIAEVDRAWSPSLSESLVEGHPEVSFSEMAGAPVLTRKSSTEGRTQRVDLLRAHLDVDVEAALADTPKAWRIDAIDALALAWSATRVAMGNATWLGGDVDGCGRPMQLVL